MVWLGEMMEWFGSIPRLAGLRIWMFCLIRHGIWCRLRSILKSISRFYFFTRVLVIYPLLPLVDVLITVVIVPVVIIGVGGFVIAVLSRYWESWRNWLIVGE